MVWQGYDGADTDIYGVKIDALGNVGSVHNISDISLSNPIIHSSDPQIAVDPSGTGYVVWSGAYLYNNNTGVDIFLAKINSNGDIGFIGSFNCEASQGVGDNIDDHYPQIAVDASGNSYITWQRFDNWGIYWVKVDASEVATEVKRISPTTYYGAGLTPQIAIDSSGNSYIVYQGWIEGDKETQIYWIRVDSTGGVLVKKASTHPDNVEYQNRNPQIAVDSIGNSYVTWQCKDQLNIERGPKIYWVRVDSSGNTGVVQKITMCDSNYSPQIAVDPSANSYITWYGSGECINYWGDHLIYWIKIDSQGNMGEVRHISTYIENIGTCLPLGIPNNNMPQIAVDTLGNSHITWSTRGYVGTPSGDVFFASIDTAIPITSNVSATPNPTNNAPTVTLTATIDDSTTGNSKIAAAEFFIDTVGTFGLGLPMNPSDGMFDSVTENVVASVNVSGLPNGDHILSVHGQDDHGKWGVIQSYIISIVNANTGPRTSNIQVTPNPTDCSPNITLTATIDDSSTGNSNIIAAEYFIDTEGVEGTGIVMNVQDGSFDEATEDVTAIINVTSLSIGIHRIYVHGQDAEGSWGPVQSETFMNNCIPTSIPELLSPTNNATNVCPLSGLIFDWTDSSGSTPITYQVQIAIDNTFVTTIVDQSELVTSDYVYAGTLNANTTYFWRVRASNAFGSSEWSGVWSFTTGMCTGTAPSVPELVAPANSATNVCQLTGLSFDWSDSSGATPITYQIQIATDNTFVAPLIDQSGLGASGYTYAGTLNANTTYFWRVRASNVYGTSEWSSVWSFATGVCTGIRYVATTGNNVGNNCTNPALPCKTITYAVNQAQAGNTISVSTGTYNRSLGEVFPIRINKNLNLVGAGATTTIIDATRSGRNVIIVNGVTANINGFTIKGGLSGLRYENGSSGAITNNTIILNNRDGIRNENLSSLTITNNTISENGSSGIFNNNSSPTIANNSINGNDERGIYNTNSSNSSITSNTISENGFCGILNENSSPIIANNVIIGNSGRGIRNNSSNPMITNNTLTLNGKDGILNENSSNPTITNNIITSNGTTGNFYGISASRNSNPVNTYNDVWKNGNTGSKNYHNTAGGTGSLSVDPGFISSTDFHLQCASSVINAGNNNAPGIPSTDKDGNQRIIGGTVDMGAYEANCTALTTTMLIIPSCQLY